ncbi:MAG: hypothetical protein ISS28_07855 [Candidatus Cloacimonetes bacterium]|nr:hypothetical protein [Candidatus Cloacimonadota bacterium]MBL7086991.1 hypothetical protein [Candidatus Cloacimonadota bacterium]
MRKLIMVSPEDFSLEMKKEEITNIVNMFCDYLNFYRVKSRPTKYEIMGPVSKILEMAKNSKRYTSGSIKSKALRKHEMNKISEGYVSNEAFGKLEDAVDSLMSFREELPEMQIKNVMELIDGEIYFKQRKKNVEKFEKTKSYFVEFLKIKYTSDIKEFNQKWDKNFNDWSEIPYPSKKYESDGNEFIKSNVVNFWKEIKGMKGEKDE